MSLRDHDPVRRLLQAGFPLMEMTAEQREVLSALSDEEITLLIQIKVRLDETGEEIQAHGLSAGAGIF
jgi:hypothetical protein